MRFPMPWFLLLAASKIWLPLCSCCLRRG
jgi:hypothetical protein